MYYHVYQAVNNKIVRIAIAKDKQMAIRMVTQWKARGFFFIETKRKSVKPFDVAHTLSWYVAGDNGVVKLSKKR